eukprot:13539313-Alexandrium_andersonii.AAC.1
MSASLVGSEMCIRDRSWLQTPPYQASSGGFGVISRAESDGDDETGWRAPVSYTHLTLPTICSV